MSSSSQLKSCWGETRQAEQALPHRVERSWPVEEQVLQQDPFQPHHP